MNELKPLKPHPMNNEQPTTRRRYFIAEGEFSDKTKEDCNRLFKEQRKRMADFLAQFGAQHCMHRDGYITAVLLKEHKELKVPLGMKRAGRHAGPDGTYCAFQPSGNNKEARRIRDEIKAVGSFCPSDYLVGQFKCGAMIASADGRSRTGMSMWMSTAWISPKNVLIVQVPESSNEPYEPHPEFREIKHSQYVAITEEEE